MAETLSLNLNQTLNRSAEAIDYEIWTDGSCSPNPGAGGWGAVLIRCSDGAIREIFGGERETTNNRMEILAAIAALEHVPEGARAVVVTDSQYVQKGITSWIHGWKARGWKRHLGTKREHDVLNRDLWEMLDALCARVQPEWRWIKGHAGHEWNERADELAVQGRGSL